MEIEEGVIKYNIGNSSQWQKSLSLRVATIIERVGTICKELEEWSWNGSYEANAFQFYNDSAEQSGLELSATMTNKILGLFIEPELLSVSLQTLASYQHRLSFFYDELDLLDIDTIKHEMLSLSYLPLAASENARNLVSSSELWLDEVSACIITSFVQELPRISALRLSLSKWSTRLSVFREASSFLTKHNNSVLALNFASHLNDRRESSQFSGNCLSLYDLQHLQHRINQHIAEAGRHLDSMLDLLICSEEKLPNTWLIKFETMEEAHIQFRYVVHTSYLRHKISSQRMEKSDKVAEIEASKSIKITETKISMNSEDVNTRQRQEQVEDNGANDKNIIEQSNFPLGISVGKARNTNQESAYILKSFAHEKDLKDSDEIFEADNGANNFVTISTVSSVASKFSLYEENIKVSAKLTEGAKDTSCTERGASEDPGLPVIRLEEGGISILNLAGDVVTPDTAVQYETRFSNRHNDSPSCTQYITKRPLSQVPAPKLNALQRKRHSKKVLPILNEPRSATDNKENANIHEGLSTGDRISKHINDILETFPSDIEHKKKMADRSDLVAPRQKQKPRSSSARFVTPSKKYITIEPANISTKSDKFEQVESGQDVKVYHLSQTGQEKPIKLFVRLVGDHGERIMVRVGGGWADLGAYLRQYAGIHNRRAVSERKFEVHNAPTLQTSSSAPGSSPSLPSTPCSRSKFASELCSPEEICINKRPSSSKSNLSHSSGLIGVSTPSTVHVGGKKTSSGKSISTPKCESLAITHPTPSPVFSNLKGSLAGTWSGDEFGLAGRDAKKQQLSDETSRWVENMIGKARNVSTNTTGTPEFGDLGNIGKTKRVWLKKSTNDTRA